MLVVSLISGAQCLLPEVRPASLAIVSFIGTVFKPEPTNLRSTWIRIEERTGEWRAKLTVEGANPQSPQAGTYSVKALQAVGPDIKWTDKGGAVPGIQIVPHQKFLNEAALNSLRDDPEDPEFRGLLLDLSE